MVRVFSFLGFVEGIGAVSVIFPHHLIIFAQTFGEDLNSLFVEDDHFCS